MMADHPIDMTETHIHALRAGRKTQMRVPLTPANLRVWTGGLDHPGRYVRPDEAMFAAATNNPRDWRHIEGRFSWTTDPAPHQAGAVMAQWLGKVRYAIGDRLWVRETCCETPQGVSYRADSGPMDANARIAARLPSEFRWLRSTRMPRHASRYTLTVTDLRIQPLQSLSDEDAQAEGFESGQMDDGFGPRDIGGGFTIESPGTWASASGMFLVDWHRQRYPDWDGYSDPPVIVLTFTAADRNIDAPTDCRREMPR